MFVVLSVAGFYTQLHFFRISIYKNNLIMSYTQEQIQKALDVYNAEIEAIIDKQKEVLKPELITNITLRKDELPGVQFSTGNIDDMYEIKKAEADEGGVEGLVVFQTWDNENEEEFVYTDELSFDQLKEIFVAIYNK